MTGIVAPGWHGRPRGGGRPLPPGQYLTTDFPVLSAGPTPKVRTEKWRLELVSGAQKVDWTWQEFTALPAEKPTVDLHCVTRWSKLGTRWKGVSLDVLLAAVETTAQYAAIDCYGGYTTNLPVQDLRDGKAWIAYDYDGAPLRAEHGGPARLLVPHLYLWKSAKWVRRIRLLDRDEPGFWEEVGYHNYGNPWKEERYA